MTKITSILIAAVAAISFTACGGTAENKPANTNANAANANTAKPVAAAPTKEALLEMDKKANEAWTKGDTAYFEGMLSDKFVSFNMGQRMDKAGELKMIAGVKCDIKSSSLDDAQMIKINDDAYALVYKSTFDGSCTWQGKTEKIPSPSRAASIWVRDGDKWKGAFHSETLIIDPKSPSPAKNAAKKEEPKKDGETKKESPGNTDTLMKLHQAGWDAFKAKDAKWFGDNMASNFSFVDPAGNYVATKADAIKGWTETMKCEGITTVKVSDGMASAISPTLEVLTSKGTADGTCDGRKNGPLWQSAVYAKEGETWKLVFMFESPGM